MTYFFGTLSPFEIIVALVAFITGGYTFYKSFLEGPKLSIYPADSLGLVALPDRKASSFNLLCNIVNKGSKVGTLHHLETEMISPNGNRYTFVWSQFFRYREGGNSLDKVSDIYPIAINHHDSKLLFVQFELFPQGNTFKWEEGSYQFTIIGWVNRKNRKQGSNINTFFNLIVDKTLAQELLKTGGELYLVRNVPLQEWLPDNPERA